MLLTEFEIDCRIDVNQLDVECLRQAELYFKWAERSIEAKKTVDSLKLSLDTIQAERELRVRKNPDKFGLEKATEASIKAVVAIDAHYIAAHEEYHAAKNDAMVLDKAEKAIEMKKRMLEVLVTLHGQQYFAGPSAPRDLKEAWSQQLQKREAQVVSRQRKRIRVRKRRKKVD